MSTSTAAFEYADALNKRIGGTPVIRPCVADQPLLLPAVGGSGVKHAWTATVEPSRLTAEQQTRLFQVTLPVTLAGMDQASQPLTDAVHQEHFVHTFDGDVLFLTGTPVMTSDAAKEKHPAFVHVSHSLIRLLHRPPGVDITFLCGILVHPDFRQVGAGSYTLERIREHTKGSTHVACRTQNARVLKMMRTIGTRVWPLEAFIDAERDVVVANGNKQLDAAPSVQVTRPDIAELGAWLAQAVGGPSYDPATMVHRRLYTDANLIGVFSKPLHRDVVHGLRTFEDRYLDTILDRPRGDAVLLVAECAAQQQEQQQQQQQQS